MHESTGLQLRSLHFRARSSAVLLCVLVICSCGGGGGSSNSGATAPPVPVSQQPPADPAWVQGKYSAPSTYAAYCATPRTGSDPATGAPYPDQLGSSVWENFWLRSWTNSYYLWYAEVTDINPASETTVSYFKSMKTTALDPTGAPKDRFHFTYPTADWYALSQSDRSVGYGATWAVVARSPPRQVYVAYTDPGTPATATNTSLQRGEKMLLADGIDVVLATDQTSIDKINAALSPTKAGETHSFVFEEADGSQRTITLTATDIVSNPVQHVSTFVEPDGSVVGYMLFNDNLATAEGALYTAFKTLQGAAVNDLILDLRYNGGGYLDIASEAAYMIAGPGLTANQTFEKALFNDKWQTLNPFTNQPISPTPFHATSQGIDPTLKVGTALPSLNLSRVYVLTLGGTCSASEAIINSLRGVGVTVIQIGSTTCGKPYAFYPDDNCGTTYFSIQMKGVNNQGFGDYPDGFTPINSPTAASASVSLPGCAVGDDFKHALGDPNEGLLAAALAYRANGAAACPSASGISLATVQRVPQVRRIEPMMIRLLRHQRP